MLENKLLQPDVSFLGIPIGTDVRNVRLAREVELPERQTFGTWEVARSGCSKSRQI